MIALVVAALLGCGDGGGAECSEEQPCGFGETCVEGRCVAAGCASSAQCGMEQYCDGGTCVDGCAEDADCYPGDACNAETATCEPAACRSATLDCDYRQFCDPATGECYDAAGYYCQACTNDEDCGGNGNLCLYFGLGRQYCGVTCGSEDDCPSGFTCVPVEVDGTLTSQCITYCWLYQDREARRVAVPPARRGRPAAGPHPVPAGALEAAARHRAGEAR